MIVSVNQSITMATYTSSEEDFSKFYEEYKNVVVDRLKVVSLFNRGIISAKDLDQRLAGMTIYQVRFKDDMEDLLDGYREGGGDISEMKGMFDYIVEASEDIDFLIEKVEEQCELGNGSPGIKIADIDLSKIDLA